jgi:heme/copper-type cytochrome/quinol oxidase subunit 3
MTANRSRSAQPIGDRAHGAAMGTWGLWQTIIVLAMFSLGLLAAPLYLETAQPRQPLTGEPRPGWPPEGIPVPGVGRAVGALLLVAVAAVVLLAAQRYVRAGLERLGTIMVTTSGVVMAVATGVLVADLGAAPFRWDEHAYTSVYWVLTGMTLTLTGAGVILLGSVVVQLLTGIVDADRHLELVNANWYVWSVLVLSAVLLAGAHLHPRIAGGGT